MANNTNNIRTGVIDIPGALRPLGGADSSTNQVGGVVAYTGDIYDTTLGKNQSQINQEFSESISSSSAPTYSSGLGIIISNNTINVDASQLNYDDLNGKPDLDPLIATHDDRGVVLSYANQGAYAIGDQSVAYGHSTNALGDYSIAGGNGTRAWGDKSVAFGTDTIAWGDNTIAAGNKSIAFGTESVALGENAYAKGKASGYFGKGRSVSAYVIDSEVGVANSDPWYTLSLESSASSAAGYPDGRGTEGFRVLPGMYITEYGTDDYPQQPGWLIKNVEYIPMNLDWVCKVYIDDPNDDAPSDPQLLVVRGIVSEGYSYALGRYLFTTNQSEVAVGDYNVSHKSGGSAASGSGTIFSVGTGVLSDNSEYIPESMADPENYLISNQTYRANAIEVLTNGSVYVRGVGGYDGKSIANVDSLQTVVTDVNTRLSDLETALSSSSSSSSYITYSEGKGYSIGDTTTASGENSFAEGNGTVASGECSHAEGSATRAIETSSHAEGNGTTASGKFSHAEGTSTTASGKSSHAEGNGTEAIGESSHAEGNRTTASGKFSHAEGTSTSASGYYSHAEGDRTGATRYCSHAEGYKTSAEADYSHAEGEETEATGTSSHAEGYGTQTTNTAEHASGKYNQSTSSLTQFSVGVGTDQQNRANAFEVDVNGNVYIKGIGTYDGTNIGANGVKSVQLVITELTLQIAALTNNL